MNKTSRQLAAMLCAASAIVNLGAVAKAAAKKNAMPSVVVAPAIPLVPTGPESQKLDPLAAGDPAMASVAAGNPGGGNGLWGSIADTPRYLLIMGSLDGFGAAKSPIGTCFAGKNNNDISEELIAAGFGSQNVAGLPDALKRLIPADCKGSTARTYKVELLKGMQSADLATYLTGAVRAYATIASCTPINQGYAVTYAADVISKSPNEAEPSTVLEDALKKGCNGPDAALSTTVPASK